MNIEKTIYQVIKENALNNKENIAYDFLDYTKAYSDFLEDIDRCAIYLHEIGIEKDDIVSIFLPNVPRALVLYYALNKIGAISNFIHPNISISENKEILKEINPKAIFLLDSMYDKINEFRKNGINSKCIIVSISESLTNKHKLLYKVKERYYKAKIEISDSVFYYNDKNIKMRIIDEFKDYNTTATILFTGGTTGKPKGICLSSKNMNASAYQTSLYRMDDNETDKMLAILPVFHGYGLVNCIHATLFEKGTIILLPYYKDKLFINTIIKKKPNYILGIPTLYSKMVDLLRNMEIDLSFIKGLYSGGSKLSNTILNQMNTLLVEKNSKAVLLEGYGLSECVGACALMPKDKFKEGSVGMPYKEVKVKIVDTNTHKELNSNLIGEICIQSDTVMIGYFNEKNNKNKKIQLINDERWLFTGDVGYIDNEGYIFFIDRIKRMVKILGYEVYPSKIEDIINSIENVVESCVVEKKREGISYLKVYVVINDKRKKDIKNNIVKVCEKNLSKWSIPREIEFVKYIPKTLLNKNDYRKLTSN